VTGSASVKCAATARFVQITREYHCLNLNAMITTLREEAKRNASMLPLFSAFALSV
jgi:hypothetical protein